MYLEEAFLRGFVTQHNTGTDQVKRKGSGTVKLCAGIVQIIFRMWTHFTAAPSLDLYNVTE